MAMHPGEVHEQIERTRTEESKGIGLAIAVLAVPSTAILSVPAPLV